MENLNIKKIISVAVGLTIGMELYEYLTIGQFDVIRLLTICSILLILLFLYQNFINKEAGE